MNVEILAKVSEKILKEIGEGLERGSDLKQDQPPTRSASRLNGPLENIVQISLDSLTTLSGGLTDFRQKKIQQTLDIYQGILSF